MAVRKVVKITDLIINPTNARYIVPLDEYDEKIAIEALCNDKDNHMERLLYDIAENGLNPNELPIIMPSQAVSGKYEVMDGNRRLTCVKLLLQYKDDIGMFNIPKVVISTVKKSIAINISNEVECVLSDNEDFINELLEKLHTHKTGISTVSWKPMAQERHNYKKGDVTKVNALVRFLETSKYNNDTIINNLNKKGWVHKFKRFINNNKTIRYYFGFEFDKDLNRINMFIHEEEIVKGLAQLVQDSINQPADGFAQKEEDRNKYLDIFEQQKIVNKLRINDPVLAYHIKDGHISATTITPLPSIPNENNVVESNGEAQEKGIELDDKTKTDITKNFQQSRLEDKEIKKDKATNNDNEINEASYKRKDKNQTTELRACLIPRYISYKVTDQRTIDLLEELQSTPIKGHRNLIAMGLRGFIEFSVSVFINEKSTNFNKNRKDLLDKIKHTVDKLEHVYGQKVLKTKIPKVYQVINSTNTTSEFGDVAMFNLFVHHHEFHPREDDLKIIYNNYEPYLKLLWDEINKK